MLDFKGRGDCEAGEAGTDGTDAGGIKGWVRIAGDGVPGGDVGGREFGSSTGVVHQIFRRADCNTEKCVLV